MFLRFSDIKDVNVVVVVTFYFFLQFFFYNVILALVFHLNLISVLSEFIY